MELTRILEIPAGLHMPVAAQQADPYLLTALAFTFFGLILVIHSRMQRQANTRRAAENQASVEKLAATVNQLTEGIQRIDQNLQQLGQRLEQLHLSRGNSNDLRQAAYLVRDGASTDQLVDLCGMSRGEAELFQRLHA